MLYDEANEILGHVQLLYWRSLSFLHLNEKNHEDIVGFSKDDKIAYLFQSFDVVEVRKDVNDIGVNAKDNVVCFSAAYYITSHRECISSTVNIFFCDGWSVGR